MHIHPLPEGNFIAQGNHTLVPLTTPNAAGIAIGIHPFLIRTHTHTILLDTGIGIINPQTDMPILYENLKAQGVDRASVTEILFSHLHYDHIGGAVLDKKPYEVSFPNATHYIHKEDFTLTLANPNIPATLKERLIFLTQNAKIVWLSETSGLLFEKITYGVTHGHSPFHIHYFLHDEQGATIFFGGDEAPQHYQMRMRIIAKYDHNGREAARLRQEWYTQAQAEKWTFLFYHEIQNPIYQIS